MPALQLPVPLVRDDAVCLRVTPFSETSQVVTLLTRDHGRVRLLAKGATRRTKAGKGKFDGGLDLLDRGDALFAHALEKDLSLLTEWKLTDGHRPLRRDLRACWLGLYAAELLDKLLEEHDPHPRLFDGLIRLLARLADAEVREAVFLAFQLNLLRQSGVLPDFARCADRTPIARILERGETVVFDPNESRLICGDAADRVRRGVPVPPASLGAIVSLLRLARAGGGLPTLARADVDPANRMLAAHVQSVIEGRLRLARYVAP